MHVSNHMIHKCPNYCIDHIGTNLKDFTTTFEIREAELKNVINFED